ncbi:MAG: FAD-dependent oxidoreductase [Candidatus Nezhaarchaeota archaeon]|nr:FAD-dependent oxidoreductase [Candidatus Nezhaarchaeota archaeon]MCX8142590.1 FAD-dependent oxidoreductase [Candidatus Nezhaarchaeota archaeon]
MKIMKLFEPIEFSGIKVKNRIVMPAVELHYHTIEGGVTDRLLNFYRKRAEGGIGFAIVGVAKIEPHFFGGIAAYDDKYIPDLKKIVDVFHEHDVKCALQLWHPGRYEVPLDTNRVPVAPSPIPPPIFTKLTPRELTKGEILQIEEEFADAALRAKKAGFDAVELIGSAGYLISQFFSPATNKRTDEYGGSIENRARFAVEIIERIKEKCGRNYPVMIRIPGDEFIEGGNTVREMKQIAKILEVAGIAAINVMAGWHESKVPLTTMLVPRGGFAYLAAEIKSVVSVPVIASHRINDPFVAEKILQEGMADMVAMLRALIADPELPKKAMEGRFDEIRYCVACNQGCLDMAFQGQPVTCLVNPIVGRESEFENLRADHPKKVVIVGGGPGGCEAAELLAIKGHKVVLFEETSMLGGQLNLAARSPVAYEFAEVSKYYMNVLPKLGVDLRYNTRADVEEVLAENPDVVIIATGASPLIPKIPGIENAVTAFDILAEKKKAGERVVIIGGGGVGCYVAAKLVNDGKKVTIVEMLPKIGGDLGISTRWTILLYLRERGVEMLTNTKAVEIKSDAVVVEQDGMVKRIPCNTVVVAVGTRSNDGLYDKLRGRVKEIHKIGDCVTPRKALDATREAAELALKI